MPDKNIGLLFDLIIIITYRFQTKTETNVKQIKFNKLKMTAHTISVTQQSFYPITTYNTHYRSDMHRMNR